jgi:outer membrane lipoprotein LolB
VIAWSAVVRARASLAAALLFAIFSIAGCASGPHANRVFEQPPNHWSGRLALTVASDPPQSYSAGFTLQGDAQAGELSLTSPLGGTLAVLQWQPGSALLRQGEETRRFDSLDELTAALASAPLPVRALFDWLRGAPQTPGGWQADLARLPQGRLAARRLTPAPAAELRLALDDE